ncbi:WecB/TagA/CpsF family glycosyltransferase [Pelagovum sp. HNIBRBA483]|uniref:WecB/TagA/CpsF family glycosyltransferase n=1 Tax=Pelagovum sp. HNIBRBA483 TaxID=3233341 RepID=UPI0034A36CFC
MIIKRHTATILGRMSRMFFDFEEQVFRTSQIPPLERMVVSESSRYDCQVIGFANPYSFQILYRRSELVDSVDHWYSDGGFLCSIIGLGRGEQVPRYSFDFSSIADGVFEYAKSNCLSVGLLGGTEDEITAACEYLQSRYLELPIVWSRNGFFRDADKQDGGRSEALDDLVASGAEIIIIGMGTPLQEEVAVELKQKMLSQRTETRTLPVIFTCGGFLSQTALGGDYYPEIIKKTGLRWVYRAFHAQHVRKRLLRDYPRFVALVFVCRLCRLILD